MMEQGGLPRVRRPRSPKEVRKAGGQQREQGQQPTGLRLAGRGGLLPMPCRMAEGDEQKGELCGERRAVRRA